LIEQSGFLQRGPERRMTKMGSVVRDVRFDRCPSCGAVIIFKKGEDVTVCDKCKIKIRLKK
jgi:hypothetical protein